MANPNIVAVTSIYGSTTYLIPTGTSATTWTALTPSVGTVNKIGSIVATNVTGTSATITVSINSAAAGGGTAYKLAHTIDVAADSTLVVIDKASSLYLEEDKSIVVTASAGGDLDVVCSYEEIS